MSEPNEEIRLAVLRGRADERDRIIKLLEELQDHFRRCSHESGQPRAIEIAIALIKGDK